MIAARRMTTIELKQFVLDYCAGRIFTTWEIAERLTDTTLVAMVFMPIALGALKQMTRKEVAGFGLIWEYLSAAGPRSINGYPMFATCRLMYSEDVDVVIPLIEAEKARQKAYVGE